MRLHLVGIGRHLTGMEMLSPSEVEKWRAVDDLSFHVAPFVPAVADDASEVALGCHLHEVRIALVEKEQSVVALQKVVELTFGALHPLKTSESLQVGTPHIGDEAARRLHIVYQRLDVSRVAGPHFHDRNLVFRAQGEERFGHSHIVVEIAPGVHHVVFLSQHGRDELLGGGLAVGARDADDGDVEPAAVLAGQFFESGEHVVDEYQSPVALFGKLPFVDHGVGASFLQGRLGKSVAVE